VSRKFCLLSVREYERIQRGEFPDCRDHPHQTKRQITAAVASGEARIFDDPGRRAVRLLGRHAPVNLYRSHLTALAAVGMTDGHQIPDRKRKRGWHPAPPRSHLRPEPPQPLPVVEKPNSEDNHFSL
jgi:hypothetical protein